MKIRLYHDGFATDEECEADKTSMVISCSNCHSFYLQKPDAPITLGVRLVKGIPDTEPVYLSVPMCPCCLPTGAMKRMYKTAKKLEPKKMKGDLPAEERIEWIGSN